MKIGLLITQFPPDVSNGAELQIKQLAAELARRGHHVTVFTRRFNQRPLVQHQDGYEVRRRRVLPLPGVRMIWDMIANVWDIARCTPRPDVLLCYQTLNSGLIGVIAQTVLGIPAIVSIRGYREYRLKLSWVRRLLVPFVYRRARHIVVQTRRVLQDLREQLTLAGKANLLESIEAKVSIIPNGINLPQRERSTGTKIIYIGRLIRSKGVSDLLEALKELPEAEALIVGDGPQREHLEALADGSRITFTGRVASADVDEYLKQARLLVHPSHGEGLSNSILEAMASGVPVVATRTPSMPDVVEHEETGFLFEPGDIRQLTEYIQRLRRDDRLWQRMGIRSLDVVQQYSWDKVVPQVEQLLSVANSQRPRTERRSPVRSANMVACQGKTE